MTHILILSILILGLSGCMGRKVVVKPDEISQYNDVDWHVKSKSATGSLPLNTEQWELGGGK